MMSRIVATTAFASALAFGCAASSTSPSGPFTGAKDAAIPQNEAGPRTPRAERAWTGEKSAEIPESRERNAKDSTARSEREWTGAKTAGLPTEETPSQ